MGPARTKINHLMMSYWERRTRAGMGVAERILGPAVVDETWLKLSFREISEKNCLCLRLNNILFIEMPRSHAQIYTSKYK